LFAVLINTYLPPFLTKVSSRDVGTGNFPFRDFSIPGKFVSGSRKICRDPGKFPGKLPTFERYCAAVVLTVSVNLFKLEHHCGENGLVMHKLCSSHFSLESGL